MSGRHRAIATLLFVGSLLALAALARPAPLRASALTFPRYGHTATRLVDGRILVVGGTATGAELYNPATDTWSLTGAMRFARTGHAAVRLADGRVFVVGGSTSQLAELYDPATGKWSTSAAMSLARLAPGAALQPDGRVLVVGGIYGEASSEIYDPATDTWSPAAVNPGGPHEQSPVVAPLADGRMLVLGGSYGKTTAVELYNPKTDAWAVVSLVEQLYGVTAAPLPGDRLLIVGNNYDGNVALIFDAASGAVTRAARPPLSVIQRAVAPLADGSVLFIGLGYYSSGGATGPGALVYDRALDRWLYARSPATLRRLPTATMLDSGLVLLTGGYDLRDSALASAELYDPATAIFDKLSYLPAVSQLNPYLRTGTPDYTNVPPRGPTPTP